MAADGGPPPPPRDGGSWPNEPASFTVISDWGFDQTPPPSSADQVIPGSPGPWHIVYNGANGGGAFLDTNAGAPFSAPNTYRIFYPAGFVAGRAPATVYQVYSGASTTAYTAFWWKPSNPWSTGPGGGTKIYFQSNTGSDAVLIFHDHTINGVLGFETYVLKQGGGTMNYYENVGSSWPISLGAWHQLEMLTDIRAGTLKWWVDGMLVGNYAGVNYSSTAISVFKFSPTFGGTGATVPQDQYFWFDHVHISGS
jgi:hypothetical protein